MKRILAASALVMFIAGTVQAQSGSGSDYTVTFSTGALGAFIPDPSRAGGGRGHSGGSEVPNITGVTRSFLAGGNERTMVGGSNRTVPTASVQLVGGALANNPGAVSALTGALTAGGVPSAQAGALAQAMATLGGSPTFANLVSAIDAYNAAVRALPAGTPPPDALIAVKAALERLS